ncbi:MAG: hypothetical protein ACO1NM_08140 [Sphingobium phenoxybenzoativorans]
MNRFQQDRRGIGAGSGLSLRPPHRPPPVRQIVRGSQNIRQHWENCGKSFALDWKAVYTDSQTVFCGGFFMSFRPTWLSGFFGGRSESD